MDLWIDGSIGSIRLMDRWFNGLMDGSINVLIDGSIDQWIYR